MTCAGIADIAGTGPFMFETKDTADGIDNLVVFTAHEDYWGGAPAIKRLEVVHYATSDAVKEDLVNGRLDVVWGAGVLSDTDIVEIQNDPKLRGQIDVFHSAPLQNVILLLNTGMPPV